jgi:imidazole glycerol-phosphate synthase subunit HisF
MISKRIIPCLDIRDGRTVKGVNFVDLKDVGDPVELAKRYVLEGADELVFLDISATNEKRKTLAELVEKIAREINIPFTVGGGITSVEDVSILLKMGADKISINSAAVTRPELIREISDRFGSQCVVLAIDAKKINDKWFVFLSGGSVETAIDLFEWAEKAEQLGVGEILFTSMDHDGTKEGFAIEALKELSERVKVPIIASGGAGSSQHFTNLFRETNVDAALAASIFHSEKVKIQNVKTELRLNNIEVRFI